MIGAVAQRAWLTTGAACLLVVGVLLAAASIGLFFADSRRVHLAQGFDDRWFLDGVLDPISGAVVSDALRGIADELFEADHVELWSAGGDTVAANGRSACAYHNRQAWLRQRRAGPSVAGVPARR